VRKDVSGNASNVSGAGVSLTTGSGRLSGVDVADDHDVDVKLFLTAWLIVSDDNRMKNRLFALLQGGTSESLKLMAYPMVAVLWNV
jgi:hypothetical protein